MSNPTIEKIIAEVRATLENRAPAYGFVDLQIVLSAGKPIRFEIGTRASVLLERPPSRPGA